MSSTSTSRRSFLARGAALAAVPAVAAQQGDPITGTEAGTDAGPFAAHRQEAM
jgi:hypothetical protein